MEKNDFLFVFSRVKEETNIKNFTQLGEFLGISQPAISKAKKKGTFPTDWAFQLELKHGLLTRWILTGEGPKRHDETEAQAGSAKPSGYFAELEAWAKETSEGGNLRWVENQIDRLFPDFKAWREKSETTEADLNKVA